MEQSCGKVPRNSKITSHMEPDIFPKLCKNGPPNDVPDGAQKTFGNLSSEVNKLMAFAPEDIGFLLLFILFRGISWNSSAERFKMDAEVSTQIPTNSSGNKSKKWHGNGRTKNICFLGCEVQLPHPGILKSLQNQWRHDSGPNVTFLLLPWSPWVLPTYRKSGN